MFIFAGAWGVITGIGLFQLKAWARLSILIFIGLTAYFEASFALIPLFFRIRSGTEMPELSAAARETIFLSCILLVVIELWAGYYLTRRAARVRFGLPGISKPFSIGAIEWYLMISGISSALELLFYRGYPRMSFGVLFIGWRATVVAFLTTIIYLAFGVGLQRYTEAVRKPTIYLCLFNIANVAVFYFRPDRERAVRALFAARAVYRAPSIRALPFEAFSGFLRAASIEVFLLSLAAIWFLVSRKSDSEENLKTSSWQIDQP